LATGLSADWRKLRQSKFSLKAKNNNTRFPNKNVPIEKTVKKYINLERGDDDDDLKMPSLFLAQLEETVCRFFQVSRLFCENRPENNRWFFGGIFQPS
jgi:hypothetical protein